ncbi:MAG: hypothetical protein J1E96_01610 [Ruminococcus sp.]|nr:hypothetical protein [Ruminococcus sp.]
MDKNLYNQTMDSIRISNEAVENAIKNLKQPDAVGKVIKMKNKKHRFIKPVGAVAAALAIIIGAGIIFNINSMPSEQGTHNSFFITANAAATDDEAVKITKKFTTIGTVTPTISSWAATTSLSHICVSSDFNFNCVGDNIETITYRVKNGDNDGAISLHKYNNKIVDYGQKKKSFHGGSEWNTVRGVYGRNYYYDYVTVNYNNQLDTYYDGSRLITYYEPTSVKEGLLMKIFLEEVDDNFDETPDMTAGEVKERVNKFYQNIFKDTEVIITATFTDGSTESKTLKLGIDNIFIYDENGRVHTDETLCYKKDYDYKLTMSAKLV